MDRSNRHPAFTYLSLPFVAAVVVAATVALPSQGLAWSERYFSRGDKHNQYLARRDSIGLGLGDAMHSNRAIHTIDPWPPYARDDRLEFDGERMNLAIERYKANESIEPKGLATQGISSGDGNSSSSSDSQ